MTATIIFVAVGGAQSAVPSVIPSVIPNSVPSAVAWHYDLRPGDHLTYRYSFQRQTQGKEEQTEVKARFHTHVLVVGTNRGNISVGFQRNRESAELTEYRSKGKDRLAKEKIEFEKRMRARLSRFSEAMEISPTGEPQHSWEIARETYSHLIDSLHEVMVLPTVPIVKGESWRDNGGLGMDFRWLEDEPIHGKSCHHVEGNSRKGLLKLDYWWSPESGVIEQIILDGTYPDEGDNVHELARMELEARTRDESLGSWLESPETRLGALQAVLLSSYVPVSVEQLASPFSSQDAATQALALAIAVQRKVDITAKISPDILRSMKESHSSLIQTEMRLLAEAESDSGRASATVDECFRPLPPKAPQVKFGTSLEVATATKDVPETPYLLRVPASYRQDRPAPLLIYLSGGAGFALDAVNTAESAVSTTDYLVLYPQAAGLWWMPEIARRFDSVLNDVLRRYNVDRDRVYITGFSNGGTGALYFATLWPQRFAAVVSLMGAGECNEQIKAGLANVRNIPIFFVHGEDDPIIRPDCSTTTAAALNDYHPATAPELKILPHRGHDITLQSDEGLALSFFKNKVRNPFPRTVDLIQTDALAVRAYWVEILNGKLGKSDIDARVKPDNTIEIHSREIRSIRLHLRPETLPEHSEFRVVWNGKKMLSGSLRNICTVSLPLQAAEDPKLDLADSRDLTLP